MVWVFWLSALFLFYTFAGYPLLLWIWARVRDRSHRRAPIWPEVSVIIPAYNEGPRLADKIRNTLELDYPEDKREIIVCSDGSVDETNDIARSFADRGVKLVEIPEQRGKHYAQMKAREIARGEILVFTDSAVRIERGTLERLVSNFADPTVGCVSSEDRVFSSNGNRSGEASYVDLEMRLRRLEARAGSIVSASGSLFAARRELCDVWHSGQSSDFFIPLHTAGRRLRAIVDPECHGHYGLARREGMEFQRKVRTIVHGIDVLFTHAEMLNFFRYPMFAWQLASHKLCRWLVPFGILLLFIANCFLWNAGTFYRLTLVAQWAGYGLGLLSMKGPLTRFRPFKVAGFFMLGNLATLVSWARYLTGEKYAAWQPTRRN